MLSEGDKSWLQAFFNNIHDRFDQLERRVEKIEQRVGTIEERQSIIERCVDGLDRYVRATLNAEHRDTDVAEREREEALEALRKLELEQVALLEQHERKVRGAE
jgi:prophage DNA circulation protein